MTMESVKPEVTTEKVLILLAGTFNVPIEGLSELEGGLVAKALSFRAGGRDYVLRFMTGKMEASYAKEEFLYRNFASPELPIPEVVRVGNYEDLFFCISRKLPGRGLKSLTNEEYEKAMPSLMQTLLAIHRCDVSRWAGYGWIGDDRDGLFPSWKRFLAHANEEEREDGFFGKWHSLFESSFLERSLFDDVYGRMAELLKYCPEKRWLLHGGYGNDNVLAEGGRVTAVLDWEAMYGDFAYDIAWIDFWPRGVDHVEILGQYYEKAGMPMENYRERIACYKHYLGLGAMKFFAKTKNRQAYDWTCGLLEGLNA
jgi:hygromycin-B 4-O-kinase